MLEEIASMLAAVDRDIDRLNRRKETLINIDTALGISGIGTAVVFTATFGRETVRLAAMCMGHDGSPRWSVAGGKTKDDLGTSSFVSYLIDRSASDIVVVHPKEES